MEISIDSHKCCVLCDSQICPRLLSAMRELGGRARNFLRYGATYGGGGGHSYVRATCVGREQQLGNVVPRGFFFFASEELSAGYVAPLAAATDAPSKAGWMAVVNYERQCQNQILWRFLIARASALLSSSSSSSSSYLISSRSEQTNAVTHKMAFPESRKSILRAARCSPIFERETLIPRDVCALRRTRGKKSRLVNISVILGRRRAAFGGHAGYSPSCRNNSYDSSLYARTAVARTTEASFPSVIIPLSLESRVATRTELLAGTRRKRDWNGRDDKFKKMTRKICLPPPPAPRSELMTGLALMMISQFSSSSFSSFFVCRMRRLKSGGACQPRARVETRSRSRSRSP